MNPEIVEYQEFAESIRDSLEQQYQYHMFTGNKIEAHEVLKNLMKYRLIPEDDPRVSVKTKIFEPDIDVKDQSNWGYFDYRRKDTSGFLGRYLFSELAGYSIFEVKTIEHWGKRVEGNYSGDIMVSSFNVKVKVSQMNTKITAKRAFEDMAHYLQMCGTSLSEYNSMLELVENGVIRMFTAEIVGNTISKYRTLGFGMLKMDNNGNLVARTVIKCDALYNTWIPINDFNALFNATIQKMSSNPVISSELNNLSKGIERQNEMIANTLAQTKINRSNVDRYNAVRAARDQAKQKNKDAKNGKK